MESPDNLSPRNHIFIRNPLGFSQHMLPEEKEIASSIVIHCSSVLLNSGNTFYRVSKAELFLTRKLGQSDSGQVFIECLGGIFIHNRWLVFNREISE